jgi:hypothetical protein
LTEKMAKSYNIPVSKNSTGKNYLTYLRILNIICLCITEMLQKNKL